VDPLHFTQKAKRVIYLCMAGGPSHLETLDYKPKLAEMDGKPMPDSITKGQPIAQLQGQKLNCLGPQHPFEKFGQSGQEICSLVPQDRRESRMSYASSNRSTPNKSTMIRPILLSTPDPRYQADPAWVPGCSMV
jgi:hypothetical protein